MKTRYNNWISAHLYLCSVIISLTLLLPSSSFSEQICSQVRSTAGAGEAHIVALKTDGSLVGVGGSCCGQLSFQDWHDIISIVAGSVHTVGLKADGTVVAVGDGYYQATNVSNWQNIKAIAAGYSNTIGLKNDGTVVVAGWQGLAPLNVSDWYNIKAVAAGGYHVVGLKEDGSVVATGFGDWGQLNVSDWRNIKAIGAGYGTTYGVREDGTVIAIGYNSGGQLNVSDWYGIKAITGGHDHTVGLREDGTVVAVGLDCFGDLNVADWTDVTSIAAGDWATIGIKSDGTVIAVGYNNYGQTNVSDWTDIQQPQCLDNRPPISVAGPDQIIECGGSSGSSVLLNGSASSDPDGDPLTFTWTWPGGSAEGITPTVTFPLGITVVTLTVSDGKATATDTVNITVRDSVPPVTTATGGSSNWYNTNVVLTFTASDNGSGVKEIHYIIDGVETVVSENYASVPVTTEGDHNISYFAVDNANNLESPKGMHVKIDKTVPTGSVVINNNATLTNSTSVTLTLAAADNLSGVAEMCVSNSTTCTAWEPYNATKNNWLLSSNPPSDVMTVYVQFKDGAGNVSSVYSDDIFMDTDNDGWRDSQDCVPIDGSIYPGAPESVGADHNCNGITVTSLTYTASTKRLVVEATSTLGQSANLQLNGGNMTWNAGQSIWTKTLANAPASPNSAMVSGTQGSDTINY